MILYALETEYIEQFISHNRDTTSYRSKEQFIDEILDVEKQSIRE